LAVAPSLPGILYVAAGAGVYKSTNGGAHWSETDVGIDTKGLIDTLTIDPLAPNTLYAGTHDGRFQEDVASGVFRSTDGGAHWETFNRGLGSSQVIELLFRGGRPTMLYSMTNAGLFVNGKLPLAHEMYLPLMAHTP
jgi:hypothetical protein